MDYFKRIGDAVTDAWRAKNFNEEALPAIAARILKEEPAHRWVDPFEPLRWVHATPALPPQLDFPGKFGQPPVTLYRSDAGVVVDVYYWLDATTTIHQHSFSGAFQVLSGSSIHTVYDFALEERINSRLEIGRVQMRSTELLTPGSTHEIASRRRFIHSLFHLERPSVSVVVRNVNQPDAGPQFTYERPSLAVDTDHQNVRLTRCLQTLKLLREFRPSDHEALLHEACAKSDLFSFIALVRAHAAGGTTAELDGVDVLLELGRPRHGDRVDLIKPVIRESRRQAAIISRRQHVRDVDHRFFLALLANCPSRAALLALTRQRFPDVDPVEKVTTWVKQLARTRSPVSDREPNALGLPLDEEALLVLDPLLRGRSVEEVESSLAESGYDASDARADIESFAACLKESYLLSVLFS